MGEFSKIVNERLKKRMASLPVVMPAANDPIRVSEPSSVLLSAVLWSDLHFSGYYSPERAMHCRTAIADLSAAQDNVDALVLAGDLAENGKRAEKDYLAEQLNTIPTVRYILPASGNHDTRLRHIAHSREKFNAFCKKVNPLIDTAHLYYSFDVNGFTFIVLGTAKIMFEECHFDNAEISFLRSELKRGTENGKPVFVILHQPLRRTHNLPHAWDYPGEEKGAVGEQSDFIRGILNGYENVFLLTGHLHRGFSINTYEDVGRIHSVNIPSLGMFNKDSALGNAGQGFLMEVYSDKILFRPRDFLTGSFLPEYDRVYHLK